MSAELKKKGKGGKINIKETVDFDYINKIVSGQEKIAHEQMIAEKKEDEPSLEKILFIFDDMLSDKSFRHHSSKLSSFACLCRHFGISLIVLSQKWNAVPNTIRMQSNITILCATDNYQKSLIVENAIHGTEKELNALYQEINGLKDFSFLVILKSNKPSERILVHKSSEDSPYF